MHYMARYIVTVLFLCFVNSLMLAQTSARTRKLITRVSRKASEIVAFRSICGMSQKICQPSPSPEELIQKIHDFIPPLTYDQHKGQSGRIGVIGGSEEYTGAPYFAAISALKLGADLAHVFCTKSAAPVIKSYSPELIVHPILDKTNAIQEILEWIPRLHAIVIGPGLGRDPQILSTVESIIGHLKTQKKPLIIDADGLFLVTKNLDLLRGYQNTILTPNPVEFKRIVDALEMTAAGMNEREITASVSQALGGVVVAKKQRFDVISDGNSVLQVRAVGSPRRCGGQGDLLSGAAAVFFNWALRMGSSTKRAHALPELKPGVLSAYAACLISKLCAEEAFKKMGRSTTTTDLIDEIHNVFESNFESLNRK